MNMIEFQRSAVWLGVSLCCAWIGGYLAAPADAAAIVSEDFEYAPGSLSGKGGGAGVWINNWTATTGQAVVNANLSFSFNNGPTVSGGNGALQVTGNNDNLLHRSLTSQNNSEIYVSFLFKRQAGAGAGGNALDDFMQIYLDTTTSGQHSNAPNIGLYDRTAGGNHLIARTTSDASKPWAQTGGATTNDSYLIVGRVSKTGALDTAYNRWDLWAFNDPNEIQPAFPSSPDSSITYSASNSAFSAIGMRTVNLDANDVLLVDELRIGTRAADVVPGIIQAIAQSDFEKPQTLDFEAVGAPNTRTKISGGDSVFTDFGITQVSATGGRLGGGGGGDKQNQTSQTGKALFFDGQDLWVLPQNDNSIDFGNNADFTLDFDRVHKRFGLTFQEQTAQDVIFSFFLDGLLQGQVRQSVRLVTNDFHGFETPFFFNRVVINGVNAGDGIGLDNLTIEAVPEPSTLGLAVLGLGCLAYRRRRVR